MSLFRRSPDRGKKRSNQTNTARTTNHRRATNTAQPARTSEPTSLAQTYKPRTNQQSAAQAQSDSTPKRRPANKRSNSRPGGGRGRRLSTTTNRATTRAGAIKTTATPSANYDKDTLRIYPLGGQEEVGRNCTVFEYGGDIIILDMGLQFADEDMPGVDYIVPNVSSLQDKKKQIRGVIFSHGHLDHIGAAPILLEQLGYPPVAGRKLTLAMVKHRVEDYKKGSAKRLKTLPIHSIDQTITLGKFKIKFFQVEHSIVDAVGVIIETPHGTVIHPGDWTIEKDPEQGTLVSYEHLAKLPSPRILMLESLGMSYTKERTPTKVMLDNLERIVSEASGRVIIGTFASQMERIAHLIKYAEKIGKKVALDGYSMKMNVNISQELGYLPEYKNTIIPIEEIHKLADDKVVILCTGAQGEPNAVFARIVNGSHRHVSIKKSDTVVFSSSIIPGNELSVQKIKDNIYRLTDNVIHSGIMDVHSGGHATAMDIKDILHQIKPDYFLPVYANYFMLVEAKKLALREGWRESNVMVLDNGQIAEFKHGVGKALKDKVNTDYVMVDGLGVGDVSEVVLRDRQVMAEDGMIVVIATIYSKTGKLVGNPDIISRGFIYMKDNKDVVEDTRKKIREVVSGASTKTRADENFLKNKLRNDVGEHLFKKTKRRPMVLPVVIKV
jgi:ribonuclease J